MSSKEEGKFEIVASMRAGWCKNQTQSENQILITPIAEPGCLELYNAKKTIHYRDIEYKEESIQISQYELRWRPLSKESSIKEIKLSITDEYEFTEYSNVKDGVVFVYRKKQSWDDRFPYFFWNQEADPIVYKRFCSSISMCFDMIMKDKVEFEKMNNQKLIDINEFIKERNAIQIFDNPAICKKFYPHVSECLRTPEGLKKIVRSSTFKKNISTFQMLMDKGGCDMASMMYMFDISELPNDGIPDLGSRTYLKRIEMWAKRELEKEKKNH